MALGYDRIVIGTQDRDVARWQADNALAAGFRRLDGYGWLGWWGNTAERVLQELAVLDGYPVGTFWLDVEQEEGAPSPANVIRLIGEAIHVCEQEEREPGIYTSQSKWKKLAGDCHDFAGLPLWAAYYSPTAGLGNWGGPFGGWSKADVVQVAESVNLCGVTVDLNTYRIKG